MYKFHRGATALTAMTFAAITLLAACGDDSDPASTDDTAAAENPANTQSTAATETPSTTEQAGATETVSVAVFNQYPPAQFVQDGELIGWMVDLLDPLAEASGLTFDISQVSNFSTIIPGLQSGRFDIAASNITVTNERMETLDFVTTNLVGTGFATAESTDLTIEEPADVCGLNVSALTGSVYEPQMQSINDECAAQGLDEATISLFPDTSAAVLAVQNGRTEAVIGSFAEIANAVQQSDALELQPYQFAQLPEAIGFPKDSPYTSRVLDAMNELIDNGTYAELLEKYGMSGVAIERSELNPEVE